MLANLVTDQYCYTVAINQIPTSLLTYSHLPTALLAILFGAFVLIVSRRLPNVTLFATCFFFALWCIADLITWFNFSVPLTMFAWSTTFFSVVFFFFAYYFLYSFITERDLPIIQKIGSLLLIAPVIIWTYTGTSISYFDANSCEAAENAFVTNYLFVTEAIFVLVSIVFSILQFRSQRDLQKRRIIVLAGSGVSIFLGLYLFTTWLASVLAAIPEYAETAYNYEIYGLFGMPILLAYLAFLIVRYRAFNIKMFGAQALVVGLLALIASEFAFVTTVTNRILVAITFVLVAAAGYLLIKSVRKEIEQREHIEELAGELQKTNERQETLIHFIGHEVKGFLTKDAGAFAAISEGDFGAPPDGMKPFVDAALVEARRGVDSVANILKASNLKKGTVTYEKAPFDMKALVVDAVEKAQMGAKAKNLELTFTAPDRSYQMLGDKNQINDHVLRNLIENAINYTPSGKIAVSLGKFGNKIVFSVKDSGVGITAEDKQRLFTEGGHGKDSVRVNAHSTGYGLYIAKQITEAHGGTIRAESEGAGKGSTFIAEFPAA